MDLSLMDQKEQVAWACRQLERQRLARWTSGNASVINRGAELVYIKPTGVLAYDLETDQVSVVHLKNEWMAGGKPSTDTASHLYVYKQHPDVGAIVHTHSTYATAFAACDMDIPCALTAMADEFGGPVRCSQYAVIGGEEIGVAITQLFRRHGPQRAVLIRQHGVFTFGVNIEQAVKAAVLIEDCAKTLSVAMGISTIQSLPKEEIDRNHERYSTSYGQKQYKQQPS